MRNSASSVRRVSSLLTGLAVRLHSRRGSGDGLRSAAVGLLDDRDAFFLEHRRCGELTPGTDGQAVWFDCVCGARSVRVVEEEKR